MNDLIITGFFFLLRNASPITHYKPNSIYLEVTYFKVGYFQVTLSTLMLILQYVDIS